MEAKDKTLVEKLVEAEERGREAGIKEVVDELQLRGDMTFNFPFANIRKEVWQAKLKEWGIEK